VREDEAGHRDVNHAFADRIAAGVQATAQDTLAVASRAHRVAGR
jgi:hypothetical protein